MSEAFELSISEYIRSIETMIDAVESHPEYTVDPSLEKTRSLLNHIHWQMELLEGMHSPKEKTEEKIIEKKKNQGQMKPQEFTSVKGSLEGIVVSGIEKTEEKNKNNVKVTKQKKIVRIPKENKSEPKESPLSTDFINHSPGLNYIKPPAPPWKPKK